MIVPNRKTEGIIYGVEKRVVYKLRVLGYSNGGNGKMSPVIYFTLGLLLLKITFIIINVKLSKQNPFGINVCVRNRQVFSLYR